MLSCAGKRSHRHTILHVSFSNSFGLASARPTPQGLSGAPKNETTGNVVSWNNAIEIGGINENGNITRPTYIALGHELAHAVDQLYKKTEYGIWTKGPNSEDIPNTEKYATYIENEIRAEAKLPLRTHYAIIGNKGYEPTRIIDKKTKKNLFYGN